MTVHTTGVTLYTPFYPYSLLTLQFEFNPFPSIPSLSQNIGVTNAPIFALVPTEFALDASNSGMIHADSTEDGGLWMANVSRTISGIWFEGTAYALNIGGHLELGPETVVGRNIVVDSSTPGGFTIDRGSLQLFLTGVNLATAIGAVHKIFDFAEEPLYFPFANLGTTTLSATTDDDGGGSWLWGHELYIPSLSLVSTLDFLGAPRTVSLTGSIYLVYDIIPEFGSFGLASLSLAALAAAAAVRRARRPPSR
jgi:hypothetical protein